MLAVLTLVLLGALIVVGVIFGPGVTVPAFAAAAVVIGGLLVAWRIAVVFLLVWIAFQNVVAPALLASGLMSVSEVRALLGTKEMMALASVSVLGLGLASKRSLVMTKVDVIWGVYTVWVLLYVINPFVARAETFYVAVSARALLMPVLFYALGRLVAISNPGGTTRLLTRAIMAINVLAVSLGVLEMFVLGDAFWRHLDIVRYWVAVKGFSPNTIVAGLPANFYGQYGISDVLGTGLRRMASVYGDPLATGYNLFFGAVLCLGEALLGPRSSRWPSTILFALLTTGIILTNTRAAMLGLGVAGTMLLVFWRPPFARRFGITVLGTLVLAVALGLREGLGSSLVTAVSLEDPSSASHMLALAAGVHRLASWRTLLGFGLGAAGAPAAESRMQMGIGESSYLVVLAEVGAVGLFLFILAILGTYRYLSRRISRRHVQPPSAIPAVAAALVGYAATALISEQVFTTTSAAMFWTLLGVGVTWRLWEERLLRPAFGSAGAGQRTGATSSADRFA